MGQKIEHIKMKLIIGSITLVVGLVVANMALFQWLKWMDVQQLFGNYAGYVLGLVGLVASFLGIMLIREAWLLRNVLKRKHKPRVGLGNAVSIRTKASNAILPTNIAERKIIVLKSRLNIDMVKLLAVKLKVKLFLRMHFLKPKPEEIKVVSIDKYYEPYIILGGKYAVDYYKKHVFPVQVHEEATEIALFGKKFKPKPDNNRPQSTTKKIELEGEALFHYEDKTYFILDRMGHEVPPEQIPIARSEQQHLEKLGELATKTRKIKISPEDEIDFLRSRIVRRPSEGEITKEIFEVNERAVVYSPMYRLTFQNVKTRKKVTVKIDGITREVIPDKRKIKTTTESVEDSIAVHMKGPQIVEDKRDLPESASTARSIHELEETASKLTKHFAKERQSPKISEVKEEPGFQSKVVGQVSRAEDNVTVVAGDLEIPSGTTFYENLIVRGCVKVGAHCQIFAKIEALRDVMIGANTEIQGNVISGGNVTIGPDSFIHGSVECVGHAEMGENAVIEGGLHSRSSVVLNRSAKIRGRDS